MKTLIIFIVISVIMAIVIIYIVKSFKPLPSVDISDAINKMAPDMTSSDYNFMADNRVTSPNLSQNTSEKKLAPAK